MMLPNVGRYQIVDLEFLLKQVPNCKMGNTKFSKSCETFLVFSHLKRSSLKESKAAQTSKTIFRPFFCQTMGERTTDGLAIVAEGHQTYENCLFLSNSVGNHFLHCITTALQSASALLLQNTDQVSHTHVCVSANVLS